MFALASNACRCLHYGWTWWWLF